MEYDMVWVNEGFVLNDAEHLIMTSYVDLRPPRARIPITGLVRGCERKYALEDSETILVSNPSRFREYGEGLILDIQEGLAREESVVTTRETASESTRQRAVSDLNEAFDLLDRRMRLKYSESNAKSNTGHNDKELHLCQGMVGLLHIDPTGGRRLGKLGGEPFLKTTITCP